jgi:hypothetical protein
MNTFQVIAVFSFLPLTLCALMVLFQWLLNRFDDRYFQRQADKARHPSMRARSAVRMLNLSLEDDFYGCVDCFQGVHGMRSVHNDMLCECCKMVLPNSYRYDEPSF